MKKLLFMIFLTGTVASLFSQNVLSKSESEGLVLMREEEKLARDVYTELYNVWKLRPFKNISRAEQTHMDRVKTLLETYKITDPVKVDQPGKFKSKELQKVYDSLIKTGKKSLYDALLVGATIEDLDIYDLEKLMKETDNKELLLVYTNLRNGSINHINAFNKQLLQRYKENYKAKYITQSYLNEILE